MADLVIGYGNTLRGDDGIGRRLVETIAEEAWPGVRTVGVHQLTPELVEEIALAERVVFADAAADDRSLRLQPLTISNPSSLGHRVDPGWLLSLCVALYGQHPPAWLLTLPARHFSFGEQLSADANRVLRDGLRLLADHLNRVHRSDLPGTPPATTITS